MDVDLRETYALLEYVHGLWLTLLLSRNVILLVVKRLQFSLWCGYSFIYVCCMPLTFTMTYKLFKFGPIILLRSNLEIACWVASILYPLAWMISCLISTRSRKRYYDFRDRYIDDECLSLWNFLVCFQVYSLALLYLMAQEANGELRNLTEFCIIGCCVSIVMVSFGPCFNAFNDGHEIPRGTLYLLLFLMGDIMKIMGVLCMPINFKLIEAEYWYKICWATVFISCFPYMILLLFNNCQHLSRKCRRWKREQLLKLENHTKEEIESQIKKSTTDLFREENIGKLILTYLEPIAEISIIRAKQPIVCPCASINDCCLSSYVHCCPFEGPTKKRNIKCYNTFNFSAVEHESLLGDFVHETRIFALEGDLEEDSLP